MNLFHKEKCYTNMLNNSGIILDKFLSETCFTFQEILRKMQDKFEVFTLGEWSQVTRRRLYLFSKEKEKVLLLKLCAIIFES